MKGKRSELIGGLLLIGFGLMALLAQFIDFSDVFGLLVLPAIAVAFLAAGLLARNPGFIIPGGIIGGIGLGVIMIEGPLSGLGGEAEGGVFMLSFAAGWALITVLTAVFTSETHWWPLIPGGIMALIGGGLLFGGAFMGALELLGNIWPLFLILGGLYLIYQGARGNGSDDTEDPIAKKAEQL
jgi:hypothetical protein